MQTLKLAGQIAILCAVFFGCDFAVARFNLPIPANVLGVIVLFLLLCTGIIKEEYVSGAADFLLRHLVFFFVPITVGLMEWGGVFYEHGLVLFGAVLLSSLLPLLATGYLTTFLHRGKS